MKRENSSKGSKGETGTQESNQPITTVQSSIDELVAGMIRTLGEIQCDPLLHYRISKRGF